MKSWARREDTQRCAPSNRRGRTSLTLEQHRQDGVLAELSKRQIPDGTVGVGEGAQRPAIGMMQTRLRAAGFDPQRTDAVFDEGHAMLDGFLSGLRAHLSKGGRGVLIISNLAELLGLRTPTFLDEKFAEHGLRCTKKLEAWAKHGKAKDKSDPLHQARSKEITTL